MKAYFHKLFCEGHATSYGLRYHNFITAQEKTKLHLLSIIELQSFDKRNSGENEPQKVWQEWMI